MNYIKIVDGLAYVTENDSYEPGDYDLPSATGLTREDAYAAALELLELAMGNALVTDEQVEIGWALDRMIDGLHGEKWAPIQIAGFAGPFDSKVPGAFAIIGFDEKDSARGKAREETR